jgi:hypothetical protein
MSRLQRTATALLVCSNLLLLNLLSSGMRVSGSGFRRFACRGSLMILTLDLVGNRRIACSLRRMRN